MPPRVSASAFPYGAYVYSAAKTDAQARSEAEGALQPAARQKPAAAGLPRSGG
ncbi:MAG: hypothetical protein ACLUNO_12005 [Oscillospiraceae bacterium]